MNKKKRFRQKKNQIDNNQPKTQSDRCANEQVNVISRLQRFSVK